jgi:hypothetical protein
MMCSPSSYPSLRDLEGKYVVTRIFAAGVGQPLFTELRIDFESPDGSQLALAKYMGWVSRWSRATCLFRFVVCWREVSTMQW